MDKFEKKKNPEFTCARIEELDSQKTSGLLKTFHQ